MAACHDIMVVMINEVLLVAVIGIDMIVLIRLLRAFRLLKIPDIEDLPAADLPTVSVCIAARNETHAMTQCLEKVVASDYPKLEVIVLDDGSRDDTSILIKSFAHSGVRFIEGEELPAGWLGKNYAQSILAQQASGSLVFFMDVDTLIERHTITRAVTYMLSKSARMISIVPMRDDGWHVSLLFATMRHFWTVIRFSTGRPKAVANAWLIDRGVLVEQFSQDASLKRSMQVETSLASLLSRSNDFRLVVSNTRMGLRYEKRWSSQVETSVRLLYPQRDKSIVKVVISCFVLLATLLPYIYVFFNHLFIVAIVLQFIIAFIYLSHMWTHFRFIGALLAPYTIAQEFVLLCISTYKYRAGSITWKGRPISNHDAH
jgi:glycosyltransferase involved in cell wall biosynthesis